MWLFPKLRLDLLLWLLCCCWCEQNDVIGSGYVTAVTLQQKFNYAGKAYILGSPSLAAELSQVGVTAIGAGVRYTYCCSQNYVTEHGNNLLLVNYRKNILPIKMHVPQIPCDGVSRFMSLMY